MALEWWRSYHGAPTDAKWVIVARKAKTKPGQVAAVWYALQDHASQASPRGSVAAHDSEALAAFYGWPVAVVERVVAALYEKDLISSDGILTSWERRQVKREDNSRERVRKHRESVTQRNAVKRNVTTDKSREEKKEKGLSIESPKKNGMQRVGDALSVVPGGRNAS